MKLLRIGEQGKEIPAIIDNQNNQSTQSDMEPYNIGCLRQDMYVADYNNLDLYSQPAGEPDVGYANCTLGVERTLQTLSGTWNMSTDLQFFYLDTTSVCFNPIVLHRETKLPLKQKTSWDVDWRAAAVVRLPPPSLPPLPVLSRQELGDLLAGRRNSHHIYQAHQDLQLQQQNDDQDQDGKCTALPPSPGFCGGDVTQPFCCPANCICVKAWTCQTASGMQC